MNEPVVARPKPFFVEAKAGRRYWWCSCGRSSKQPFCDGSHRGTEFAPIEYVASRDEDLLFCGCKHTRSPPFCDGAHNNLPGGSVLDDPMSEANRRVAVVGTFDGARAPLNGRCYVFHPARATFEVEGSLRFCEMVGASLGAEFQSQWLMRIAGDASPCVGFGASDAILFVAAGRGGVTIGGRRFDVKPLDGVYVRPHETVQFAPSDGATLEVFVLACPCVELQWPPRMSDRFDADHPVRVVPVDPAQRTAMGARYFQVLVDKRVGSAVITQFIGHIPPSKAAPHRHLYEEALIVLAGDGYMWTEDRKARVAAGDVIFLPRKQLHSLQASSSDGLDVVGVICPGDNPSINYGD